MITRYACLTTGDIVLQMQSTALMLHILRSVKNFQHVSKFLQLYQIQLKLKGLARSTSQLA